MNLQDYRNQVEDDVLDFANDCKGYCDSIDKFRDEAFLSDQVTGNASGSYTFNTYQAEENIKHLLFDDELLEMFQEYGYDRIPLEKGAEFIDVSIRCFLVDEVINKNIDEISEILGLNEGEEGE